MRLPPVIMDVTRLATRLGRAVPNGIDRVDLAYAEHFLGGEHDATGALIGLKGVPRRIEKPVAASLVASVAAGWGEDGSRGGSAARSTRLGRLRTAAARFEGPWAGRSGLWPGRDIVRSAPEGAIFLNVSQFPIWMPRYLAWLERRPDIRAVFFLHDVLPLELPEFFRPFEVRRHEGRMAAMARHAAGIIVASESTRAALARYMRSKGRPMPPVAVAPLPVSPHFSANPVPIGAAPPRHPYFVCIGTIEPRKNHLFLLQVWRDLRLRLGQETPHLVLVGQRGWDNENVVDMLVRCETLKGVVREASEIATPDLRALIANCQAVLMPTFAEGFGLPVAEALAAEVPVIASDIDVFRQLGQPGVRLVDPLDGPGWAKVICEFVNLTPRICPKFNRHEDKNAAYMLHFRHVHALLDALGGRNGLRA